MTSRSYSVSMVFAALLPAVALTNAMAVEKFPIRMWDDPKLQLHRVQSSFTPELRSVWISALESPAPDVRRRACFTIALAQRRGLKGMEAAIPRLKAVVQSSSELRLVRLEAAKALIVLNARDAAPDIAELMKDEFFDSSLTIEPALAQWKFAGAKDVWLSRLSQPSRRSVGRVMAIRGLIRLKASDLTQPLVKLLKSDVPLAVRIEAARALGLAADEATIMGLESDLLKSSKMADRLIAAHLVAGKSTPKFVAKQQALTEDNSPILQTIGVEALLKHDPDWVAENATQFLISQEPRICICGIKALQHDTSPSALRRIANRLNNRFSEVRALAQQVLLKHAQTSDGRPKVLAVIDSRLIRGFRNRWQGLEQVALLIGKLKVKDKAQLLESMISHPRREVATTSAWAISELAVPETFASVLRQATVLSRRSKMSDPNMEDTDIQFTLLLHTFANTPYRQAMPLLRRLVNKNQNIGGQPRAAAIWCLGKYYQGRTNEQLCAQFVQRLNDINSMVAESADVRAMCAVALGRIKTKLGQDSLERFAKDSNPSVRAACEWTLNKRDGTPIPPPPVKVTGDDDWFIQSLDQ